MTATDQPRPRRIVGRHRAPLPPVGSPFDEWSTRPIALRRVVDPVTDAFPPVASVLDPDGTVRLPVTTGPAPWTLMGRIPAQRLPSDPFAGRRRGR